MNFRSNIAIHFCLVIVFAGPFSSNVFSRGFLSGSSKDKSRPAQRDFFAKDPFFKNKPGGHAGIYNFAIGACGGLNPGLTFKKYIFQEGAIECILGTRWRGISLTIMYEICEGVQLRGDGLVWDFGLGPRLGFFQGKYYKDYLNASREDRLYSVLGIAGTFGFEYCFEKAPFAFGLDYRPYFDLKGADDSIIDFALNVRFIFE